MNNMSSDLAEEFKNLVYLHYKSNNDFDEIAENTILFLAPLNPFIDLQPPGCAISAVS